MSTGRRGTPLATGVGSWQQLAAGRVWASDGGATYTSQQQRSGGGGAWRVSEQGGHETVREQQREAVSNSGDGAARACVCVVVDDCR